MYGPAKAASVHQYKDAKMIYITPGQAGALVSFKSALLPKSAIRPQLPQPQVIATLGAL